MRDFFLNSAELLDAEALEELRNQNISGLLPCKCVRYNEKIRLVYYPEEYDELADVIRDQSVDELCKAAESILLRTQELLSCRELSPENVLWDPESIYLNEDREAFLICLPATVPEDSQQSQIYAKRLYSLLEDMFEETPGGEELARQIRYRQEKSFGDWQAVLYEIRRRISEENEFLILRSVNTPQPLTFRIGHEIFLIGSETGEADGLILGVEGVAPRHAEIGWNDINYYVRDLGNGSGTYVNDQIIVPGAEIPIGQGTVLRFADCTFTAE